MDMEFTNVCVWPMMPLWYRLTVALPIVYLFFGIWLAERNRYPLLALAFPVVVGTSGMMVGLVHVVRGMSLSGGGRHSAAAGVAESLFPLTIATVCTAFLALIIAVRFPKQRTTSESDQRLSWIALTGVLVLVAADVWIGRYITGLDFQLERQFPAVVRAMFWLASIYLLLTLAILIRGALRGAALLPSRLTFVTFASLCAAFAYALITLTNTFRAIAIGPIGTQG